MQNGPHEYTVDHTSFYVISKLFTQTFLIGRGDVTFLHIACVKSTKNVGKLACVFGRFKNPFFLWLIQILKAVTMIMVTAIAFFGHLRATQP
jgi:rRNA processing protein Gar1